MALTFLMVLRSGRPWILPSLTARLITVTLGVFLAIWSIGFGYGFWWSSIAGEEATRSGLPACRRMRAMSLQLWRVSMPFAASSTMWCPGPKARWLGGSQRRELRHEPERGRGPLYNARRGCAGLDHHASRRHGSRLADPRTGRR